MYNFGGIYYEMKSDIVLLVISGVIIIVCSRFWNISKRNVKEMIIGIVCILLAVGSGVYHTYIIRYPKILIHEGYFFSEHRDRIKILKMEYSFTNENELKPVFYLDVLSKKEIYPEDFDSKIKYRIFYEEETCMIVKVEVME